MDEELRVYLDERFERLETKLLTAFHSWASPVDARLRSHTATLRAPDLELEVVADRVTKLEQQKTDK